MRVRYVFALIATDKLFECRDFYVTHFGLTAAFESTIYIQRSVPADHGGCYDLALMPLDHPFGAAYREKFNGKGVLRDYRSR